MSSNDRLRVRSELGINLLALTPVVYMVNLYDRVLTSRSLATLISLVLIVIALYIFWSAAQLGPQPPAHPPFASCRLGPRGRSLRRDLPATRHAAQHQHASGPQQRAETQAVHDRPGADRGARYAVCPAFHGAWRNLPHLPRDLRHRGDRSDHAVDLRDAEDHDAAPALGERGLGRSEPPRRFNLRHAELPTRSACTVRSAVAGTSGTRIRRATGECGRVDRTPGRIQRLPRPRVDVAATQPRRLSCDRGYITAAW